MDSHQIVNKSGFVLKKERIVGGDGLLLSGCSDVVLEGLDISRSSFSGLRLHACRNIRVLGGRFYDNGRHKSGSNSGRIGHGIHLAGRCEEITVEGAECMSNFEDGVQTANSFTGTVNLVDCDFHDNMENGVDQKGGSIVHVRPNYRDNGDGRGMEAIVVHNHSVSTRIYGGRLSAKDPRGSVVKVAEGGKLLVQSTVFDARGTQSHCLLGFDDTSIELFEATLLGSRERPLVKTSGALRMVSCKMRADRNIWIIGGGGEWTKADVLRGIEAPRLAVINCREDALPG